MTHPDYWWGPMSDPHDLAVVILAKPANGITPGRLAPLGYLDELRISKGIARWTSNFTPPVVPYGEATPTPTAKRV